MRYRLLDLLICPKCESQLSLKVFENEEISCTPPRAQVCSNWCERKKADPSKVKTPCNSCFREDITEGVLTCKKCSSWYPIIKGVPRMLSPPISTHMLSSYHPDFLKKYRDALGPAEEIQSVLSQSENLKKRTLDNFSTEWLSFQDHDKDYERQFWSWIEPLMAPKDFSGQLVLNGGCGIGRHSPLIAKAGGEEIGIDLGESVEVAHRKNRANPLINTVQADIFNIPLRKVFDRVYSVGVIHHTPDPEKAFLSLSKQLKKKGRIIVWVYGREGNAFMRYCINPFKGIITRLPHPVINSMAFILAIALHAVTKGIYVPMNKLGLKRLMDKLPYNDFFCYISDFRFRHKMLLTYDHLASPIDFYISKPELEGWFRDGALRDVQIAQHLGNSWRGVGTV